VMSESRHGAPETEADGEADGDPDGLGAAVVKVGSGAGLVLTATGAEEPPGEMSHHSSARTTRTPRITTIRRRQ